MSTATTVTRALSAASQRIAPQQFAHVVLKTANYDAVIAWYATVLQARVAFRNDFIAFLTYDDEHHRVAVINNPGSPASDPAAAGVHHIAYTYADLGELLSTYRRLARAVGSSRRAASTTGRRSPCTIATPTACASSCRSIALRHHGRGARVPDGPGLRRESHRDHLRPGAVDPRLRGWTGLRRPGAAPAAPAR